MNDLERFLMPGPPLEEAADFFVKLKYAGWGDPPDETGELEGAFATDPQQVAAKAAEVAGVKLSLFMAYHVYGESMKALAQHAIGEQFREHAEQEKDAADYYLKRASVLSGGPVQLSNVEPPPALSDPEMIINTMIRAEQEGIAGQRDLRAMVGEENPMRFEIERILTEDQHHLDELWQLLPEQAAQPGAEEPAAAPEPKPSQEIKVETTAPQQPQQAAEEEPVEEPVEEEAAEVPPPQLPDAKIAVSNKWVAKGLANGLHSRAAKSGVKPRASAAENAKKLEHALGGADHKSRATQRGIVNIAKSSTKGKLDKGTPRHNRAEIKQKKHEQSVRVLGSIAVGGSVGTGAGYALGRKKEASYGKGLTHGAALGFGVGTTGTALALDRAHAWADRRSAENHSASKKTASDVIDQLLAGNMPEGKAGHIKVAALRMKLAAAKLAVGYPDGETPPMDDAASAVPSPTPAPEVPAPPAAAEPLPDNYVQNELAAQAAQNANEAAFYRGQVESSTAQTQQLQQQIEQMQQQLQQIQNQSAVSSVQVQTLTNQSQQANDRALQYSTESTNMRTGIAKMRESLMQLVSQDPEGMGTIAEQEQAAAAEQEAAMAGVGPDGQPLPQQPGQPAQPGAEGQEAAPEEAPEGGAAEAGPPAQGGEPKAPEAKEGPDKPKTSISIKSASSALPWMAGGAMAGAAAGALEDHLHGKKLPQLQQHVDQLETAEQENSTFEQALQLARAKADLEQAKLTNKFPDRTATRAALGGARMGLMLGSGLHGGLGELQEGIKRFRA